MEFNFPKRPSYNKSTGAPVKLLSNFFSFKMPENNGNVFKYNVKFEPDLPDNASRVSAQVIKLAREEL
jgi:hypothetical protein